MAQQATLQVSDTQRLKELLERVHDSDEHLVIQREGAPVAVMMSYQEYEHYRRLAAAERHKERVRVFNIEAEKQGLTEEQLYAEIKEDRKELFAERYGHLFDKQK